MTTKKAPAFLQTENRDLRTLFSKIKLITDLNAQLLPLLPDTLRDYCQVANLIQNRLILLTANASIATQIRLQSPDILTQFKQSPLLKHIQSIHCKVRPTSTHTSPPRYQTTPTVKPLSQETATIVSDIAKSLKDQKLREILEKIAQHKK
jgi:hypothetical protein